MKGKGVLKLENCSSERYPGSLRGPESLNPGDKDTAMRVIRLHMEISCNSGRSEKVTPEDMSALKEFGRVKYGETISRDVIIPQDMPLSAVHYVIQRCFGWQNLKQAHQFMLPEDRLFAVTKGELPKYLDLVGVAFQAPVMGEFERFFGEDDFEEEDFRKLSKKKYTAPYASCKEYEEFNRCKEDMEELKKEYAYVEQEHLRLGNDFEYYAEPTAISKEEYQKMQKNTIVKHTSYQGEPAIIVFEYFAFEDIPLNVVRRAWAAPVNSLLGRVKVGEILALHDKGIKDSGTIRKLPGRFMDVMDAKLQKEIRRCREANSPDDQPYCPVLTDKILYCYDLDVDWLVEITASCGAADLVESGRVSQEELDEAVEKVMTTHAPVCIAMDGLPVMENIGGLKGYCNFLMSINGAAPKTGTSSTRGGSKGSRKSANKDITLQDAKARGWSNRMPSKKTLL